MTINKQRVIQFGSGKPGEMNSATMERSLFQSLGYVDPAILFIPFHHLLHEQPNDWTMFRAIYQPLTACQIEMREIFDHPDKIQDLKVAIRQADIIVLGSGVLEYFLLILYKHNVDKVIWEEFRKGKDFWGYSAGTIAMGSLYIHPLLSEELFFYSQAIFQAVKDLAPGDKSLALEQFRMELNHDLFTPMTPEEFQKFIDPTNPPTDPHKVLGLIKMPGFEIIRGLITYPHYGEYLHSTEHHLKAAAGLEKSHRHLGIPNGMAIIHHFDAASQNPLQSRVFGKRAGLSVTEADGLGMLTRFDHNQPL